MHICLYDAMIFFTGIQKFIHIFKCIPSFTKYQNKPAIDLPYLAHSIAFHIPQTKAIHIPGNFGLWFFISSYFLMQTVA